ANRRENQRRVERFRRRLIRTARPNHAQPAREILAGRVARLRECISAAAAVMRDLREDMGGGAKTIETDAFRLARETQRAIADQSGAHQRRRLDIAELGWDDETIALVRHGILGIAAVNVVAGEPRARAEIFAAGLAIRAFAAGPPQPGHANSVADRK